MKFDAPRKNIGIVIVDDSPNLLRVYKKYFEEANLKIVAVFQSLNEVLSYFDANRNVGNSHQDKLGNSIVLMDHGMPENECKEVARKLKELNPELKIVLTTGEDLSRFKTKEKIFDAAIHKPFTISELLETIQKVVSPIRVRGTKVFDNHEEIDQLISDILSDSKEKMCSCRTTSTICRRVGVPGHKSTYVAARAKGLKVLMITEITKDSLYYCKQLMINQGVELRHIDGLLANFQVWDEKHLVEGVTSSNRSSVLGQLLYSNLEPVVGKSQHLFNKLWEKAVPGEQKIRELELSSDVGKVSLLTDQSEIARARLRIVQNTNAFLDSCVVPEQISMLLTPEIRQARVDAISKGVISRLITEISTNNLSYCKDLMKIGVEVRDLPSFKGTFSVNEKEFIAIAAKENLETSQRMTVIYSDYPEFVEQHRSIFNTLWTVAVPASTKIKEIEEDQEQESASMFDSIARD